MYKRQVCVRALALRGPLQPGSAVGAGSPCSEEDDPLIEASLGGKQGVRSAALVHVVDARLFEMVGARVDAAATQLLAGSDALTDRAASAVVALRPRARAPHDA